MSEWVKFNKAHKDSGQAVNIEGKPMYQWSCSCGSNKLLRMNSGIPLGLKIQWRSHFEEVVRLKMENSVGKRLI